MTRCFMYLRSVLGENADELVSCVRVSPVEEGGADVLGSVGHLRTTTQLVHQNCFLRFLCACVWSP